MARLAISCKECEQSIYCASWGEYKSQVHKCRIYNPEVAARACKDYKKGKKKTDDEVKCQCKSCTGNAGDE